MAKMMKNNTHHLTKANIRLLKNIYAWVLWEEKNCPKIDYATLTVEHFNHFLLAKNQDTTTMAIYPSAAPLQITVPSTPTTSQHISTSAFMPNVKLNVKQYLFLMEMGPIGLSSKREYYLLLPPMDLMMFLMKTRRHLYLETLTLPLSKT